MLSTLPLAPKRAPDVSITDEGSFVILEALSFRAESFLREFFHVKNGKVTVPASAVAGMLEEFAEKGILAE